MERLLFIKKCLIIGKLYKNLLSSLAGQQRKQIKTKKQLAKEYEKQTKVQKEINNYKELKVVVKLEMKLKNYKIK